MSELLSPMEAVEKVIDDFEALFGIRHKTDDSPYIDVRKMYADILENGLAPMPFPDDQNCSGDKERLDNNRAFFLALGLHQCVEATRSYQHGMIAKAWGMCIDAAKSAGMAAGYSSALRFGLQSILGRQSVRIRWVPNKKLRSFAIRRYMEEYPLRAETKRSANNMATLLESEVLQERDRLGASVKDEEMRRRISEWIRASAFYRSRKTPAK